MFDINKIYNMPYHEFIKLLLSDIAESVKIEILKNLKIKEKIINGINGNFFEFCEEVPYKYLEILLDEEGIKILAASEKKYSKIPYIFSCYQTISSLFDKEDFCNLIYTHIAHFYSTFSNVDVNSVIKFLKYVSDIDTMDFQRIFLELSEQMQRNVVEFLEIPYDNLKSLILYGAKEAGEYLLENDFRIMSLLEFSFEEIYKLASKGAKIPNHLLSEPRFVEIVSTMRNVKDYRLLMNKLSIGNDVSFIEQMRKNYYESEIANYNEELDMLGIYADCYNEVINVGDASVDKLASIINKHFFSIIGFEDSEAYKLFIFYTVNHSKDKLRKSLQKESHLQLTNMIIDYTFEDVPYNVFLDLKQLISFQKGEGRQLTDEEIDVYSKVIKLDELGYSEARALHERLKAYSLENIYDHFRNAKDKVASLISQVMLNEDTIQKYRDEALSEQHGVDVYVLDVDEFYAFICSLEISKHFELKRENLYFAKDGYSFTLDHSSKLSTYREPKEWYNIIYSSFPEDQLVHIFPIDSYSLYKRDDYELRNATKRIFELNTPDELIKKSENYNEIILSLANINKTDELNSCLLMPEMLGIYCFDKIQQNDVTSAQNLGVGIVLVRTDAYKKDEKNDKSQKKKNCYEDLSCGNFTEKYNYFWHIGDDDMKLRRLK